MGEGDSLCGIANLITDIRHGPLSASRAVRRRRTPVQARNRRGTLIHGAALLLGRHAWVLGMLLVLLLLGLRLLELLLRRRRAGILLLRGRRTGVLLLRLRLLVHLVLLEVRLLVVVWVLVDGGLAAGLLVREVGRRGVLVHGDCWGGYCQFGVQLYLALGGIERFCAQG